MRIKPVIYFCVLTILLLFAQAAYAQKSKSLATEDKIRTYVTDKTGTLTSTQIQSLETKLSNFDKETSTQVVVWMIPTLDGGSLEDKSYEIAEQNGIGQKGKNNGVLLFIAKDDRKLRIEVGYGLEGALTDALSSQIIRKEITPSFKKGNYYEGILAGVDAIMKATKGEYTADKKEDDGIDGSSICCIPIPALIFFVIFFFIFFLPIIRRIFGGSKSKSSNWWWTGGSGSGWSSGSSGSSWSGGGFSGGGGSFGGGGSSGSW
ncbi:MAG: TPM domain-containing protein [Ignavibacteria bacterium]|nr:TPM domain-containing protein [Ignavibacteria bacterium]MCC7158669.1 TPM domain-containing protein [Ignavibacteria bacterium]